MNDQRIIRTVVFTAAFIAGLAYPVAGAMAQTLYGIVYTGPKAGYLLSIDATTGAATDIGDTGLAAGGPSGLTYVNNALYTITRLGEQRVYRIDPATAEATLLPSADRVLNPAALAYRARDGLLYTAFSHPDGSQIWRLNSGTGAIEDTLGYVDKGNIEGLAVDSDGTIFGAAQSIGNLPPYMLFTIWPVPSTEPRDVDIGMTGWLIKGLSFHPEDGRLFGSDGERLVEINTVSGAVYEIGAFGPDIGTVGGIVFGPDQVVDDSDGDDGSSDGWVFSQDEWRPPSLWFYPYLEVPTSPPFALCRYGSYHPTCWWYEHWEPGLFNPWVYGRFPYPRPYSYGGYHQPIFGW